MDLLKEKLKKKKKNRRGIMVRVSKLQYRVYTFYHKRHIHSFKSSGNLSKQQCYHYQLSLSTITINYHHLHYNLISHYLCSYSLTCILYFVSVFKSIKKGRV